MNLLVKKSNSRLAGIVTIPPSKSHSLRAIFLAMMAKGESTIENLLDAQDINDAISVARSLGLKVVKRSNHVLFESAGFLFDSQTRQIYTGNSGVTTHFILPILGVYNHEHASYFIDCGNQMRMRPIASYLDSLAELGLKIEFLAQKNDFPIRLSGKIVGGEVEVDGITSQYASALLLALPCAERDSIITVRNLHERSYLDMTLMWLQKQHISLFHEKHHDIDRFHIRGGQQYQPFKTKIHGDYSSASYLITAGVLTESDIQLQGLVMDDKQGDKQLVNILNEMGADITVSNDSVRIRGAKQLRGMVIDAKDIPDLLPVLAVIGSQAVGKTEIINVAQARIKETDRIHSMTHGLSAMGVKIEEKTDGLVIYQSKLHHAPIDSYADHRTTMAMAIAGMLCDDFSIIHGAESVEKSFPSFFSTMQSLGATMVIKD